MTIKSTNDLIAFASDSGAALLRDVPSGMVRWALMESFAPQQNIYFCGVAAIATILRVAAERGSRLINQDDVFVSNAPGLRRIEQVLNLEPGSYPGLAMEDALGILGHRFGDVTLHYGSDVDEAAFKSIFVEAYTADDTYLIVNFDGRPLGLDSVGHFATVAAYHASTERVLLLDPAAHKRGWFWVTLADLHKSFLPVRDVPEFQGLSRGFLEIHTKGRGDA